MIETALPQVLNWRLRLCHGLLTTRALGTCNSRSPQGRSRRNCSPGVRYVIIQPALINHAAKAVQTDVRIADVTIGLARLLDAG